MKIVKTISEMQTLRQSVMATEKLSVGFVPTMGALHSGHAQLIQQSVRENDFTVVSIFVNPTQFNNPADLEKYPKTWDADVALCESLAVDYLFSPDEAQLYADQYRFRVTENKESLQLEGEFRPGHFNGVLSVVLKLFNITQPTRAYFGEKDWQQLQLISDMARALFLPVQVIPVATVREQNGLAMSSRNLRLSADELKLAPALHKAMTTHANLADAEKELTDLGFKVEYIRDWNGRRLAAAHLGAIRLIDNVSLNDVALRGKEASL